VVSIATLGADYDYNYATRSNNEQLHTQPYILNR